MKKFNKILSCVLALVMVISLISVYGVSASADSANALVIGKTVNVSISAKEDMVTYTYTPDKTGYYAFYSSVTDEQDDPYCNIYDSEDNEVAANDDVADENYNFYLSCYMEKGETYTIYISAYEFCTFKVSSAKCIAPTSISIDQGDTAVVKKGTFGRFSATVGPDGAVAGTPEWKSSDTDVAEAYGDGYVEFYKEGTAVITVTTENGHSDSITVTVEDYDTVSVGDTVTFTPEYEISDTMYYFRPERTGFYEFEQVSGPSAVVIVIPENLSDIMGSDVLGSEKFYTGCQLQGGTNYYVAVAHAKPSDEQIKFKITERVDQNGAPVTVTSLSLPSTYKTEYMQGDDFESGFTLTAKFNDDSTRNLTNGYTLYSFDPYTVGEQTVEIMYGGVTVSYDIVVKPRVALSASDITIDVGEEFQFEVTTDPEDAEVYWYTNDSYIASVTEDGKIKGLLPGTCTIEASIYYNEEYISTYCDVTVNPVNIVNTTKVFRDVEKGKWYVNAVNYAYSYGFISGMSTTEYGVGTDVTRGMFITILARIAGVDTDDNDVETIFTDVEKGRYYTNAIAWASETGVVSGMTEDTFAPNSPIQRQQLCKMIVNFAEYMGIELTASVAKIKFADASSIYNYAKEAVAICQQADIVSGYNEGGKALFKPTETATREEAAQMLYKFHSKFIASMY